MNIEARQKRTNFTSLTKLDGGVFFVCETFVYQLKFGRQQLFFYLQIKKSGSVSFFRLMRP